MIEINIKQNIVCALNNAVEVENKEHASDHAAPPML